MAAVNKLHPKKSLGQDLFYSAQLKMSECKREADRDSKQMDMLLKGQLTIQLHRFIEQTFNGRDSIPEYLRDAKTIPLSKTGCAIVQPEDIRTIAAYGDMTKLYEALLLTAFQKIAIRKGQTQSFLFQTPSYQMGFKTGLSTEYPTVQLLNTSALMELNKKEWYYISLDFRKAYDCMPRARLF
jgi:hypothetical protein